MAQLLMPAGLQAYFDKGIQAFSQGCYDYAVDLLAYVVKQAPQATEARRYLRLAIQKQYSVQPPSLFEHLGRAGLTWFLQWFAGAFELQGRMAQATHLYEWLLTLTPRSRILLLRLASVLNRQGLIDSAIQTYEELLAIDPNHVVALRRLSNLSMKQGDDPKARRCLERILQLHPGDVEAQQNLRNLDALGTIKKGFTT